MNPMKSFKIFWLVFAVGMIPTGNAGPSSALLFHARQRFPVPGQTNVWIPIQRTVHLDPSHTAVIVCDVWDRHWCSSAQHRVQEMAPRVDRFLRALRKRGVFIIHAPSDTMSFYAGTPQRKRAQQARSLGEKRFPHLKRWYGWDATRESPLPIDDSDGGCDAPGVGKPSRVWTRENPAIWIAPQDAVSDSGPEIFGLLAQRQIRHVLILGVHLNMCVLGRPFGIRQLVTQGFQTFLVRDLTDTMYNPRRRPWVSHFVGTDLMIEHVERYWCPTVVSSDILGGSPFHFAEDRRPTIVWIIGENEYHTWETLPCFAARELAWRGFRSIFVTASTNLTDFAFHPIRPIAQADLLVISVRRRALPRSMMELIRAHLRSGKPLLGIRTASHAFAPRGQSLSLARQNPNLAIWPDFDPEILGGHYHGHYRPGPIVQIHPAQAARAHPILHSVNLHNAKAFGSLYQVRPLKPDTVPLLYGSIPNHSPEPVAWTRHLSTGSRIFYTSLGHSQDFAQPWFRHLLGNAVYWCLGMTPPPVWTQDPMPDWDAVYPCLSSP